MVQAFRSLSLPWSVKDHLRVRDREHGHDEATLVESFVILNATGGECVDDFKRLREDLGLAEIIGHELRSPSAALRFLHSNPPALTPGTNPALVVNSYGKGKAIWIAAPIESSSDQVNARVIVSLVKRVLLGPCKFEVETNPAVEMTLFHHVEKQRLLAGLLNMPEQMPPIPVEATVRVRVPIGQKSHGGFSFAGAEGIEVGRDRPQCTVQVGAL